MDLIDDLLLAEEAGLLNERRYTVRDRPNHMDLWNDTEFFMRFRFSKITVRYILELLGNKLEHPTERNNAVTPEHQLLLTLRFYASGCFYIVAGDFAGVHKSTAGKIIKRVTKEIATLSRMFIRLPSTEIEMRETMGDFFNIAKFPRVIGAIDCTHVKIQSPGGDRAENFRNRKGFFSLNVQVVGNARNQISNIVARWPGSSHDSHIFNNSNIRMRFERGDFGNKLLLGDSGYPNRSYVITPLNEPSTPAQRLFNESQIRTRNVVERLFGMWKRRFPILSLGLKCNIELSQDIIVATAVLHNIAIEMNDELPHEEIEEMGNIEIIGVQQNNNRVREELIQYFESLL